MARGQKYPDEIKEKAFLLYATCGNYNEVSRQLCVPYATVKGWIDGKKPDELDKLREEKKRGFIDKASDIIDKGLRLLNRRLDRAIEHENDLDKLIDEIYRTGKEELSQEEKNRLVSKIRSLQIQNMRDITTAIGTLYDKRALAKGDSTDNQSIVIEIKGDAKDWSV